jgi:7,8-dihydropterin-6-yl-methyl-4-(beta-D-ribofuranosyl)aminobenzene 5'-phosphate synthase
VATRLTVLVDDRADALGLAAEHGLALWIEHDGHKILFDTGASGRVLLANATALGIRLEEAEAACLSHGHYDHTGGLGALVPRLRGARLYAHPAAFGPRYARSSTGWRSIGIGLSRGALEAAGIHVHLSEEPQEVCPGACLTGEVARDAQFVPQTPHLWADGPSGRQADPFHDDQALVLRGEDGPLVVSGCAHAGIINHCRAAARLMDDERLRAVVGGFHLVSGPPQLVQRTIEALRDLDVGAVHPGHCTGKAAMAALTQAFPGRCEPYVVGSVLIFGQSPSTGE